jgi:hypothetical protein
MIAVIQCAATKRCDAGHLRQRDGTKVMFVADPAKAPADSECLFVRPDDVSDSGATWRQVLAEYNANPANNPFRLLRAFELYKNAAYRGLVKELTFESNVAHYANPRLEPITLLSALAGITSNIGLLATASASYTEPYNLARMFASLDHLS